MNGYEFGNPRTMTELTSKKLSFKSVMPLSLAGVRTAQLGNQEA